MAYQSWIAEIEFTAGVWTDVTAYVDTARMPFDITGGDTPEASADPGSTALPLKNSDQRFTPGNVLSPYSPNVVPGKRCRIRDVIADQVIKLFTGYLQFPQIDSWAGGNAAAPRDQIVMVPFVDLVSFVADSRVLGPVLTEHIRYRGGSDLKGFWPLTNEAAPFNGVGPTASPMTVTRSTSGSFPPLAVATARTGDAPRAAEFNGLRCTRVYDAATGSEAFNRVMAPTGFTPTIASGDSVTAVFWFSHHTASLLPFQQLLVMNISGSSSITIELLRSSTDGSWSLSASGAQTASISGAAVVGLDALLPIGIRYCPSPANMELWVGSQRLTTTPAGAPPTGMTLAGPDFGFQFGAYDLNNVQVYAGTSWGYTDYLEQQRQAEAPLDRQLTGDRIRTALAYAGITVPTYRVDPGTAVMSAARTNGRKASDLIADAVETEQGEYYADGDGLPVLADRLRLFNL